MGGSAMDKPVSDVAGRCPETSEIVSEIRALFFCSIHRIKTMKSTAMIQKSQNNRGIFCIIETISAMPASQGNICGYMNLHGHNVFSLVIVYSMMYF